MAKLDFSSKKIIVTGASSGVGRETAIRLSNTGAKVIIIARREEKLKETLSAMFGSEHGYKVSDVSDFDGFVETIKEIVASDGKKIDYIAHCAGAVLPAPLRSITRSALDFAFTTNLYSFAAVLKCAASKKLFNEGGAVVGVSGMVSIYGQAGNGVYAAAKGALNALVKSAAKELAPRKIRVNAVCPGGILTDMVKNLPTNGLGPSDGEKVPANILLPEYVASAIVSFMSDDMKYVSGTVLEMDEKLGINM